MHGIGREIWFYREKKGISQQCLADRLQISVARLRAWEADDQMPGADSVRAVCQALEIDPNALYEWQRYAYSDTETAILKSYRKIMGNKSLRTWVDTTMLAAVNLAEVWGDEPIEPDPDDGVVSPFPGGWL